MVAPGLPAGWLATNNIGSAPLWVTTTATPDSAPNDAFIGNASSTTDKRLDTPSIFVMSASAQLSFRNNFNTEMSGGVFWDGCVLEVSSPNINGDVHRRYESRGRGELYLRRLHRRDQH